MERDKKPELREMFGPWVYISPDPLFKPRYRVVEILIFMSTGVTCGIASANMLHTLLGEHRGTVACTVLIVAVAALQVWYFVAENRRMKTMYEEIKANSKRVEMMMQDAPPEAADGPTSVQ